MEQEASGLVRLRVNPPDPGQIHVVDVEGIAVAIANVGGRLRAFDDRCTHRGCSLSKGTLAGPTVICSCHGGRFDLRSGDVLDEPPTVPIRVRAVSQDGEFLLIEA